VDEHLGADHLMNIFNEKRKMKFELPKSLIYLLFSFSFILTLFTLVNYPGRGYIYVLFSLLLNLLLFFGLRKESIFFDTFIGVLFWLGYWLKFSVRTAFLEGNFAESVGYFDYSGNAYDHALLVTSCGVSALLVARFIREKYLFTYSSAEFKKSELEGLLNFYKEYKTLIWVGFFILFLSIALTNVYFGIYQRGSVPRTILPYKLGSIYTWLLLFGSASISSLLLHFELKLHGKIPYIVILLVLLETLFSNVSMLSRGMVLNASALLVGVYVSSKIHKTRFRFRTTFITITTFLFLFACSVLLVNHIRTQKYWPSVATDTTQQAIIMRESTKLLFLDRWVGIEGMMAVSSYPKLGWDLWKEAWREKYFTHGTTLYDIKIARSPSAQLDLSNHHWITLPGILAFFYYPGSYFFLFILMFMVGMLGAGIEIAVFKLGGSNLILCSLIAFVVAYRYTHFGYVPTRSYLLLGAIALNVSLIYLVNKFLWYRNKASKVGYRPSE
jgi:hypothetical protein